MSVYMNVTHECVIMLILSSVTEFAIHTGPFIYYLTGSDNFTKLDGGSMKRHGTLKSVIAIVDTFRLK